MLVSDQFSSSYMNSEYVDNNRGAMLLTIHQVRLASFDSNGQIEKKLCVTFDECDAELACNAVNRKSLVENLGDDTDLWIGQQVVVFTEPGSFRGRPCRCVRVRLPRSQSPTARTNGHSVGVQPSRGVRVAASFPAAGSAQPERRISPVDLSDANDDIPF
jgi:hypothetical protein